jgi:putative tryptophan/tyrosine transport system substrate-binding protein
MKRSRVRSLRRRGFIAVLGGAAAWPLAGHAERPERMRRLGVLISFRERDPLAKAYVTAFAQALGRLGSMEDKNIQLDYRFASGDPTLLNAYAAELVGLAPDALLASTAPAVMALRQQTRTIPIVFATVADPVGLGLVQSLARPGGNLTAFSSYDGAMIGKWLQLLKEVAPNVTRVAVIFSPETTAPALLTSAIEGAGPSLEITVRPTPVHDDASIEEAIAVEAQGPGGGLVCLPDSFNVSHREAIVTSAARRGLPLIGTPDFLRSGGLMSYFFNSVELYPRAASYIDRILRGASPADLPVQQPTKYSLIINLKTAKALGLTVPPAMLDLADEVIE